QRIDVSQNSKWWADKQWHERQRIEGENLCMRQYRRDWGHDQVENPENVPGDSQRERVRPTFGDGEAHEWRDQTGEEVSHSRRNRKAGRQDAVVEKWVQEQESCNSVGLRQNAHEERYASRPFDGNRKRGLIQKRIVEKRHQHQDVPMSVTGA